MARPTTRPDVAATTVLMTGHKAQTSRLAVIAPPRPPPRQLVNGLAYVVRGIDLLHRHLAVLMLQLVKHRTHNLARSRSMGLLPPSAGGVRLIGFTADDGVEELVDGDDDAAEVGA
jgi:hypothetical protein